MTSDLPSGIESAHAREAGGLPAGALALTVLGAMIAAALSGMLGGTPSEPTSATSRFADITVVHPQILRSGMFFEASVELTAREPLSDAVIAMTPAVWRSITINTEMPQPSREDYANGYFRLHFGPLGPGRQIRVKLDGQINPDLFAGTQGEVAAFDGNRRLTALPVETRVLP